MDQHEANEAVTVELPVLPLRDVVVYPNMVIPLFVGREKSIQALELAMESDKQILGIGRINAVFL
jgi:ATP-dependent Lon protease